MFSIDAPLYLKLKEYSSKKRISFAMPGHKRGKGIARDFARKIIQYDVTELPDTENLYEPQEALKKAKKAAADYFCANDTYFLINGSTAGIYAMISAVCSPGDTILVNRAIHISVINACIMLGVKPEFIHQNIIDGFCVPAGVDSKKLSEALDEHYNAKAVLITSPSYYGVSSDIDALSAITHAKGIPLLVDEAHGAHFSVNEGLFPKSAMKQGADLAVCSAHKTLNALNQAAFLNVGSDNLIDRRRLEIVMSMQQTSSPSYVIAASADIARAEVMTTYGRQAWRNTYELCDSMRKKLEAATDIMFITKEMNGTNSINNIDETRIVMNFSNYNIKGFEVKDILRNKYNIDMEMADLFNVVGIATPSNTIRDFNALVKALKKICSELQKTDEEPVFPEIPIPKMEMLPQKAFYSKGRSVRLDEAVGCISRSTIVAYPPAIPIVCAGEKVTEQSVGYIDALKEMNANIIGLNANGFISIVDTD